MSFPYLEQMVLSSFEAMRPSEHLSVTEAAEKYHIVRQPGSHSGPWSLAKTPYLQEPQDVLTELDYTGMVFVGPARTGKSAMMLNWLVHTAITDPTDMMLVHMSQQTAREWSHGDLNKALNHSPKLREKLRPGRINDNTFDKTFLSGMRLGITWPTVKNLSSKTIQRVWFMDYDRLPDDLEGEGTPYYLGKKRTTTFGRFAMTAAESSPNPDKEITDPKWRPKTPHQAPPIKGIFQLYNRGDRRRFYWRCPQCEDTFEPAFELLKYPVSADLMESSEQVEMICPHCGFWMPPSMKDELNQSGRWVKEGFRWSENGKMVLRNGHSPNRSDTASFWLKGPAAGFQAWSSLVYEFLMAERAYEETGDEAPLRKTVTTDQGTYYIPKSRISDRLPEDLKNMAEDWGSEEVAPTVPLGVRFLIATIDVQARAFVVQVNGFTNTGDLVIIDGFKIRKSDRKDADDDVLPIDPASFAEDWNTIKSKVIDRTYSLGDGSGRKMRIRLTGCDSGGREGVTFLAYNFWRKLRSAGNGDHQRFALVKGDGSKGAPRAMVTWPDSGRKDKMSAARGDVPVVRLNSDLLKDQVAGMLNRRIADGESESGGGMIRYPSWFEDWFYKQMTTENRTEKGWVNPAKRRNESFDLTYYAIGLAVRPFDRTCPLAHIGFDRIDFDGTPPSWAQEWDDNDMVSAPDEPMRFGSSTKPQLSLADLAAKLA